MFEVAHEECGVLKKMKSMVVKRSRTIAPGYGDLILGHAELEEVKSLRVLGVLLEHMH